MKLVGNNTIMKRNIGWSSNYYALPLNNMGAFIYDTKGDQL